MEGELRAKALTGVPISCKKNLIAGIRNFMLALKDMPKSQKAFGAGLCLHLEKTEQDSFLAAGKR